MSEAGVDRLAHQLEDAQLDIAIANGSVGFGAAFRSQRLYTERYVVIFPPGAVVRTMICGVAGSTTIGGLVVRYQ